MSFSSQSHSTRLSRQATSGSSLARSSSVNNQTQPSSSSSAPSRPVTRHFLKNQQQNQQLMNPQTANNSSLTSFSSLSSSNSSLNSMDTTQIENRFNPFLSTETNSLISQLNQDMYLFGKNRSADFNKKREEDKTYQKILTNEKPANIINLIENTKIFGRMSNNVLNLPNSTLGFMTQRLKAHDYPLLIKRLDQSSIIQNLRYGSHEFEDLVQVLRDIENRLINYNPNANDPDNMNEDDGHTREEFEVETIDAESANMFRQYGGIEILKRILLLSILTEEQSLDNINSKAYTQEKNTKVTKERNKIELEKCFILKIKLIGLIYKRAETAERKTA